MARTARRAPGFLLLFAALLQAQRDPRFPTAGTILGTFPSPTSLNPFPSGAGIHDADYDNARHVVWLCDQVIGPGSNDRNIFAMDPLSRSVVQSFAFGNHQCPGGQPASVAGFTGITVTVDNHLICTDFNGDLRTIDDYAVEFTQEGSLLSSWALDSATCPSTCRANDNTNTPQMRLAGVSGITSINARTSTPGPFGPFLISQSGHPGPSPNPVIAVVEFRAGCPGTWRWINGFNVPGLNQPAGLSWDPGLQSLWAIDRSTSGPGNKIYELKYHLDSNSATVVQSWPSPESWYSIWVVGIHDPDVDPGHEVWGGATGNNTVIRYDSGHSTGGVALHPPAEPGGMDIELIADPQDHGNPFKAVLHFGIGSIEFDLGDRRKLRAALDALFGFTWQVPHAPPWFEGLEGTFQVTGGTPTPSNPPKAFIRIRGGETLAGIRLELAKLTFEAGARYSAVNHITWHIGFSFFLSRRQSPP